jgi:hypothetical protein
MKNFLILSLCCLLASVPTEAQQVSCTSASAVTPVGSGDCAGMSFDFLVHFTYSDGTTKDFPAGGVNGVMGVCATPYPACDISSTITPTEQLPQVDSFNVTFESSGQRALYSWSVSQPSILEQKSACPCTGTTNNPAGFTGFIAGSLSDVTSDTIGAGPLYVYC